MAAIPLTKKDFQSTIQNGVTLVDFWAPWCGPCQIQLPILHALADEIKDQATLATVDVGVVVELPTQFGIRSIPALLLFNEGKLVEAMIGVNQKDSLKSKVLNLISSP